MSRRGNNRFLLEIGRLSSIIDHLTPLRPAAVQQSLRCNALPPRERSCWPRLSQNIPRARPGTHRLPSVAFQGNVFTNTRLDIYAEAWMISDAVCFDCYKHIRTSRPLRSFLTTALFGKATTSLKLWLSKTTVEDKTYAYAATIDKHLCGNRSALAMRKRCVHPKLNLHVG